MQIGTQKSILKVANNLLPQDSWLYKKSMHAFLRATYDFRMNQQKLISIELPIIDKCNLNCGRCLTFAPLVDSKNQKVYEINSFKRDVMQLAKIDHGHRIRMVNLTGGEALLNKDIEQYIKTARQAFPNTVLRIRTNGLLINKMPESFWDTCRDNNVEFVLTEYPLKYVQDAKDIIHKRGFKISVSVYGGDDKKMFFFPLNKTEEQKESYKICPQNNAGYISVLNGKAYKCLTPAFVHILNKHFDLNFEKSAEDSLDIHKIDNTADIAEFSTKPIPFCKYCDYKNAKFGLTWMVTQKKQSEWVKS